MLKNQRTEVSFRNKCVYYPRTIIKVERAKEKMVAIIKVLESIKNKIRNLKVVCNVSHSHWILSSLKRMLKFTIDNQLFKMISQKLVKPLHWKKSRSIDQMESRFNCPIINAGRTLNIKIMLLQLKEFLKL